MTSIEQNAIYRGNSIISIEKIEEYPHPVVIKKPFKRHPSRQSLPKDNGVASSFLTYSEE